jgi:hypothetical protein
MAKKTTNKIADKKKNKINLPSSGGGEEVKRKMVRIKPKEHEMAKFNPQRMRLQEYIEALINLDAEGAVDWSKHEK